MTKPSPRYFKKRAQQHLKLMTLRAQKLREAKENPLLYKINKRTEMLKIFAANRRHSRALLVDLDGTLIPFKKGKRKHRSPHLRPHWEKFLSEIQKFADVFIYSAMSITRMENLWKTYLKSHFSGYFDRQFLCRRKKSLKFLEEIDPRCSLLMILLT